MNYIYIWKVMRLFVFFFIGFILHVQANTYAQTITLHANNISLKEVVKTIRKQTDFTVFGANELLNNASKIDVNVVEMPVLKFVDLVLKNQPIQAQIQGKTILLTSKPKATEPLYKSDDLVQSQVAGVVLDEKGNPMVGATIYLLDASKKRTNTFVQSDESGNFRITVPHFDVFLEVTFLGYHPQIISGGKEKLIIKLSLFSEKIEDVVVTGYNTIRKESFTGNSISVTQEELIKVNNRNLVDALQVFDPSFRLEVNNLMGSDPNTLPEFYIRGRSGIGLKSLDEVDVSEAALTNNPNLPIFIMDGYEVTAERVYDFDITRIKNITILKDAAATAVYGSRSANGVVVIETIPPTPGKLRIDYNLVLSQVLPDLKDYNLMNAAEKLEAEKMAGYYYLSPTSTLAERSAITRELLLKENQIAKGVNTDWISQPLQNEFNHKHTLNIDGGSENLRFNLMIKYDLQNGVMKESSRQRKGGILGIDYRQNKFQIRNDFSYDIVNAKDSPYGEFNVFTQKLPYDEIYDSNGIPIKSSPLWHTNNSSGLVRFNPIYEVFNTNSFSQNGYYNLANNTSLIWNFLPNLQLKADVALTRQNTLTEKFIDPFSSKYNINANTDFTNIGELTNKRVENIGYNTNLFLRYDNRIGFHNMNFSAGFNAREATLRSSFEYYSGFPSSEQNSPNFAAKIVRKPSYADNKTRLIGSFIALNYSYKDIYLFDASGRLDGSSEFGSENRVAPFWSLGTGINFHNYTWFEKQSLINRLRISGTTGQLGKTNFPPYASKGMYSYLEGWYTTGNGSLLMAME